MALKDTTALWFSEEDNNFKHSVKHLQQPPPKYTVARTTTAQKMQVCLLRWRGNRQLCGPYWFQMVLLFCHCRSDAAAAKPKQNEQMWFLRTSTLVHHYQPCKTWFGLTIDFTALQVLYRPAQLSIKTRLNLRQRLKYDYGDYGASGNEKWRIGSWRFFSSTECLWPIIPPY